MRIFGGNQKLEKSAISKNISRYSSSSLSKIIHFHQGSKRRFSTCRRLLAWTILDFLWMNPNLDIAKKTKIILFVDFQTQAFLKLPSWILESISPSTSLFCQKWVSFVHLRLLYLLRCHLKCFQKVFFTFSKNFCLEEYFFRTFRSTFDSLFFKILENAFSSN